MTEAEKAILEELQGIRHVMEQLPVAIGEEVKHVLAGFRKEQEDAAQRMRDMERRMRDPLGPR
jgi:hypothetical protein